ncbi:DUF4272 domain-containing protein [Litorimonas sp. WD9-15]|uniref:DUF4272 domain-containing protein n=1 Tax=Litorimonas sp. WD9-15 TaxID=3418716 RepID=UPI003D064CF3
MSYEEIPEDFNFVSAENVAKRALALFGVWLLSIDATPRQDVIKWIKGNDLWSSLSPKEAVFLNDPNATEKQKISYSWQAERLHILLWALNEITELAPAHEKCETDIFQKAFSPLNQTTAQRYLKTANLRDELEILSLCETIENYHWEARNAQIKNQAPKIKVDIEIIQERHHAINWVLWGEYENWDDITTDT